MGLICHIAPHMGNRTVCAAFKDSLCYYGSTIWRVCIVCFTATLDWQTVKTVTIKLQLIAEPQLNTESSVLAGF